MNHNFLPQWEILGEYDQRLYSLVSGQPFLSPWQRLVRWVRSVL